MLIRLKVPYDNGTVRLAAGETTTDLPDNLASRLVRSGLAEEIRGNRGVNISRAKSGLPPIKGRSRAKK
jgi:hypothetical protein